MNTDKTVEELNAEPKRVTYTHLKTGMVFDAEEFILIEAPMSLPDYEIRNIAFDIAAKQNMPNSVVSGELIESNREGGLEASG